MDVRRRTIVLVAVAVALAVVARTAVVVGNYTLAKEDMRRQYEKHAEELVESTKAYATSWARWALNCIRVGLGFKPTPLSDPAHPINYEDEDEDEDEDDDDDRPGKAEEIKSMAIAKADGEVEAATTTSTEKQRARNKAEEAEAEQVYDTAKKRAQETVDAAKEKYAAAAAARKQVNDVRDCVSNGCECKDEL